MTYTAVSLTGPLGIRPNYRYSRRISTFLSLHVTTFTHIKCPVLHFLCIWFPLSIINSKKLLLKEQSKINTRALQSNETANFIDKKTTISISERNTTTFHSRVTPIHNP
jgi:hypothetical protein